MISLKRTFIPKDHYVPGEKCLDLQEPLNVTINCFVQRLEVVREVFDTHGDYRAACVGCDQVNTHTHTQAEAGSRRLGCELTLCRVSPLLGLSPLLQTHAVCIRQWMHM